MYITNVPVEGGLFPDVDGVFNFPYNVVSFPAYDTKMKNICNGMASFKATQLHYFVYPWGYPLSSLQGIKQLLLCM